LVFTTARLVEMTEAKDDELIAAAIAALSLSPLIHSPILSEIDKRHLLRYFWLALLATYITRGRPSLNPASLEDMFASQLKASELVQAQVEATALTLTYPVSLMGVRAFLSASHDYPQCKGLFMRLAQLCLSPN